ncbi:MAG TPA: zinc ribbon domain-containing protein [archaeon]|nr:zinc ribbon domain-containing protein [archaeon]
MALCNNCGKKIPDEATYCPYCGASVQSVTGMPIDQSQVMGPQSIRPSIVTYVTILFFIFGIFSLFSLDVFSLIIGGLELVAGYGLWTLKKWSRSLGIVLAAYGVFSAIVTLILVAYYPSDIPTGSSLEIYLFSAAIQLVIYAFILWLLFRPNLKAAFMR